MAAQQRFFSDNKENVNTTNNKDQFKATKIWNEILQAFYLGIELKKHRKNMKSYYDCFTASEAVTWLKNFLRQYDQINGTKVTRFQALNLLRKYYKSSIIERVKSDKNDSEIQDNNDLFRFSVNANENLPFLTTSKSEQDLLDSCSSVDLKNIELNLNEKIEIYKKAAWKQMTAISSNLSDYLKLDKLDGTSLFNNVTRVNTNGVVQLTDKTQDLPHWIMSAMKCLANWPKASGSGNCLPKYEGFEFDVFKLIKEYFTNMEEPIIPSDFYHLITAIFELYLDELSGKKRSFKYNNELNLPSNCVYETAFSGKDPVTKIVSIDELSVAFPNLIEYFQRNSKNLGANFGRTVNHISSVSPTVTPNNSFKTISTMPRNAKLKSIDTLTPKVLNQSGKSDINFAIESPPEAGEYMLNKDFNLKKFYSLRKNTKFSYSDIVPQKRNVKNHYYELLQLILLVLPSPNRRHLQLLIRVFYKILRNKDLCLMTKDSIALKEHIVNTFTRSIFRSIKECDFNELKANEFVSFLIDECMSIFEVPPRFTAEVEEATTEVKNKKAKGSEVHYCEQISNEEFEMQRDVMSEIALSELLESIMRDDTLSERDKLKWIKQFKMYHPDVYDIYFTNCSTRVPSSKTRQAEEAPDDVTSNRRTRSMAAGFTRIANKNLVKRFLSLKV